MTIDLNQLNIIHNLTAEQFEVEIEGEMCVLQYKRRGDALLFYHTGVPPELEGQGIANRLGYVAMEYVKENSLKAVPRCEFMEVYLRKHKEYKDWVKT
jgi:predicted GNAT family acetyltransferase